MSFNILLLQIVFFSCLFSLLRSPRLPRGWLIVSSVILIILVVAYVVVPDRAGWISGGFWALFVATPLIGFARVNRLFYQERYRQARKLASRLRWLHPADGWLEYPDVLLGLELAQQDQLEAAKQVFQRHSRVTNSTGRIATAFLYRMGAQWDELLTWIRCNWSEEKIFRDSTIALHYLRALGETGEVNELVRSLALFEQQFEKSSDAITLNVARLLVLAFCGQSQLVQQLLTGPLKIYSPEMRQFWLATADWAAGYERSSREALLTLQQHCDPSMYNAITWRLSHSLIPLQQLTAESRDTLTQLTQTIRQEARYGGRANGTSSKPYVTYGLIGLNSLIFALEMWWGGSENLATLYRMGALVPENLPSDWWRLISALFLHYGAVHLLANMIALLAIGGFVEATLGHFKFLLVYFFSGIGSMLAIAALAMLTQVSDLLAVGASGAIMGLLGVMAAILLKGWRQEKARIAARRLRLVLLIVVLQVVFDVFTPQVSLVGHASGLILGFFAGSCLFQVSPGDRVVESGTPLH
ncbi:rhomboid family intramembrane serine protease [Thermocoleostomius sinensis]|uniref:Rhomboid family intramembrane serine protease n=1 Tax=Thermocoleostomius sinensis A174 TaxID=2016057 RepID=A0A9E8ZGJ4_9CYAN|nr:rhomboid family intramembrane serine protease [Thermocoleostomius sinensis]WAL62692.1 rhomboid family intramembrane serine protease [Thermocoleostomius sinensis A174]